MFSVSFTRCQCLSFPTKGVHTRQAVALYFDRLAVYLQAGYYCSVCDCILRDSASYLDHINGKYHNRALGMSMRVERSTADQVSYVSYWECCQIALHTWECAYPPLQLPPLSELVCLKRKSMTLQRVLYGLRSR